MQGISASTHIDGTEREETVVWMKDANSQFYQHQERELHI